MIHYRYEQGSLVVWLENLAKLLGIEKKRSFFNLPEELGDGLLYASTLLNDMSLLYVNAQFRQDVLFDRLPSKDAGVILFFYQIDIAGEFKVSSGDQVMIDRDGKSNTTFLGSTQFPWQLNIPAGTMIRAIAIRFSEHLVGKFMKGDKFQQFQNYLQQNLNNAAKEELTPELMKLLNELYQSDISTQFGQLILQNRALLLVEKYLQNFLIHLFPISKNVRIRKDDRERLAMVEEVLSGETDEFPTIDKLSKMAMMSSTKLKKRFKEVYGMKLYEYFNYSRLQKAKSLIESGEATVKEAASQIGFANLSNFSKAFKKEFGVLPKKLKSIVDSHLSS